MRAYLRFKSRGADGLVFDDVNASPALIQQLLLPLTQTNVVPQLQLPDGSFVQDSDIIEAVEAIPAAHHSLRDRGSWTAAAALAQVLSAATNVRQRLSTGAGHTGRAWHFMAATARPARSDIHRSNGCPAAPSPGSQSPRLQRAAVGRFYRTRREPRASPPLRRDADRQRATAEGEERGGLRALGVTSVNRGGVRGCTLLSSRRTSQPVLPSCLATARPLRTTGYVARSTRTCTKIQFTEDSLPAGITVVRAPARPRRAIRAAAALHLRPSNRVAGSARLGLGTTVWQWYSDDEVPPTLTMLRCFFDEFWPVLVSTARITSGRGRTALGAEAGVSQPLPSNRFHPRCRSRWGVGR